MEIIHLRTAMGHLKLAGVPCYTEDLARCEHMTCYAERVGRYAESLRLQLQCDEKAPYICIARAYAPRVTFCSCAFSVYSTFYPSAF